MDNQGTLDVSGRPGSGESESKPEPRTVATDRGLGWWTDAWALFMRNPVMWVVLGLIFIVAMMAVGMVPLLGGVVIALVLPALAGGWMLAARKVQEGGALEVGDLFLGFQGERIGPLLVLGALLLAAMVVIGLVAGVLGAGAAFGVMMGGARHSAGGWVIDRLAATAAAGHSTAGDEMARVCGGGEGFWGAHACLLSVRAMIVGHACGGGPARVKAKKKPTRVGRWAVSSPQVRTSLGVVPVSRPVCFLAAAGVADL